MAILPPQLGSGKPKAPLIPYLSDYQHPLPLLPSVSGEFDAADDPFTRQALEAEDINPPGAKSSPSRQQISPIQPPDSEPRVVLSRVAQFGDLPLPSALGSARVEFQCKRGHGGSRPTFVCPQGCELCANCLKELVQRSKQVYPRCECGRVLGLVEKASLTS